MSKSIIILMISFLSTEGAWGGDRALILSGGGNPKLYGDRYEEISKKAYDVFTKKKKVPTQVIAKDGSWGFVKTADNFPATNKENVKKIIAANLRALKPGEVLDLFINDHGTKMGNDKNKTLKNTGIVLYSETSQKPEIITHQELADLIQENKPQGAFVKMVGIHCYSGGLNEIAAKIDGVCGSTSTGDENVTISSTINKHGEGFFNKLDHSYSKNDGNNDLISLHAAAVENDILNNSRNQLSSQAYLESVMPSFDRANYSISQLETDINAMLTNPNNEQTGTLGKLNSELKARQFLCSAHSVLSHEPQIKSLADVGEDIGMKFSPEGALINRALSQIEKRQTPMKDYLKKRWPDFRTSLTNFEITKKKLKEELETEISLIQPPSAVASEKTKEKYLNILRKNYRDFRNQFKTSDGNLYEAMSIVRQTEIVRRALKSTGLTFKEKVKLASIYNCESSSF